MFNAPTAGRISGLLSRSASSFLHLNKTASSVAIFCLLLSVSGSEALATDYYLSASGSDGNSGVSQSAPWRSLSRANQAIFSAGDRILLRSGDTFPGGLYLDSRDRGSASQPITVTSYGSGRAKISAGTGDGIRAYNTAGIAISDLLIVGSSWRTSVGSGIEFFMDLPGTTLDTIIVDRVEVVGFKNGIDIGAWAGTSGYQNIAISHCISKNNRENGITVWGYDAPGHVGYSHRNVHIDQCSSYGNSGPKSVGNGIIISNIAGGTIERSVAHSNGLRNTTGDGPVGIWAWRATNIRIQNNESYDNHSSDGGHDGNGFDLDGGVTNSVLQYNYSHGNDGAGYMLAQYKNALPFSGNVIRYNISENDGRRNFYSGIYVWSYTDYGVQGAQIFNNTIYVTPTSFGLPRGIAVVSKTNNVRISNNIIVTTAGVSLLETVPGQTGMRIEGNAYWSSGGAFRIKWAGSYYTRLWDFRATGQERMNGKKTGFEVDPQLTSPGAAITFGKAAKLRSLMAYTLKPTSPLLDKGLNLHALFGVDAGPHDFYGTPIPSNGQFEVGAYEAPENSKASIAVKASGSARR